MRQLLISACVLLAGLALSGLGSLQLLEMTRARERRAIEEQAASKAEQAQIAINRTLESLGSIRAFHDAHGSFSADAFARFVKSDAAFHPGTLALGWVPRVRQSDREAFERDLQPVAGRTAAIFEVNWHGLLVNSPVRADYFPVQYLVSLTDGELVQGMDLAAISWLKGPLAASIASGATAVVLRPRTATGSDFVIQAFAPVFRGGLDGAAIGDRERIAGFAMGVFDVSSIFRSIFDAASEPYNVVVYAATRNAQSPPVFALAAEIVPANAETLARQNRDAWTREFQVADQVWRAMFLPRRGITPSYRLAYMGLAAGIALTTMLAAYLFLAQWRMAQVLQLSRSLRETERRLFDERVAAAVQGRLRQRAQDSEIAKTRLLQAASHDLRQPMHALGLYLGNAMADVAGGLSGNRWLPSMQRAFESLHGMFDALLDWSRLESGRLQPHAVAVELGPLLQRLGAEYASLALARALRFRLHAIDAIVITDAVLLERVLRNLLANALHYTEYGDVVLSARRRGDEVCVRIADTGPGIPAADRQRVFAAFERGGQVRERHDGLGLGLAIAAQTVVLLGHRLRLTSHVGRGTIVSVSMPVDGAVSVLAPAKHDAVGDGFGGRRLLVVDDDAEQLAHMVGLLSRWGAAVQGVRGLADARPCLADAGFDAVIVDQHLGDGNGLALIDELAGTRRGLAVLLVTGDVALIEALRRQRPTLMVLAKPVAPLRLRSVLHFLMTPAARESPGKEAGTKTA